MIEMTKDEFMQFIEDYYLSGHMTKAERAAHLKFVDSKKEIISISVEIYGKQLETQVIYK